jgi:hypothetical protein
MVTGAESEVLDVGRSTAIWPPGLRRAITARDSGCVFPGCDRPPSWCDIHHCNPWSEGAPTALDNGALLCRVHHTYVHNQQCQVHIPAPGAKPEVLHADGRPFTIRRHQPTWQTTKCETPTSLQPQPHDGT